MAVTTTDLLGPLTTLWTPPTVCLSTVTYTPEATFIIDGDTSTQAEALMLGATNNAVNLACYPPQYTTDHVYSPGICPSGWTSACAPETAGAFFFSAPTTGVQCCPSGMTCNINNGFSDFAFCAIETDTSRAAWIVTQADHGPEGTLTSTNFPSTTVLAKPIFVAYQSSDQAILAAATRQTASSTREVSGSDGTGTGIPSPTSSLSGGAIAGIVIGAIAAGIIIAAMTFFFLRFCFGYRRVRSESPSPGATTGGGWHWRSEQSMRRSPHYQSSRKSQQPMMELPTIGQTLSGRHELGEPSMVNK